jgi:hypothetical protein
MEVARHQRQHSNLQCQRHYEQLPDSKGQRQAACQAMARCLTQPAGRRRFIQRTKERKSMRNCGARLVRSIPRNVLPASQGPHIRLHRLFQPGHSQTRNAADGHEWELKAAAIATAGSFMTSFATSLASRCGRSAGTSRTSAFL